MARRMRSRIVVNFSALTLNMQNGQVWDDRCPDTAPVCLDETIAFLRAHPADLIFLQEVEVGYDGGYQAEPPPHFVQLRQALSAYESWFEYPPVNPTELPFGLGLAIFSRFPLLDRKVTVLPSADLSFHFAGLPRRPSARLLLTCRVVVGDRQVCLGNTHLQAYFMLGTSSDKYPEQRRQVIETLSPHSHPVLLAGDFNSAPEEGLLTEFAAAGLTTVQQTVPTWRRRPYVTDHLFFNTHLTKRTHQVIPTACSDHHAIYAEFSFSS